MRTYRASSLGYSLEALVAPHLGYAPVDPPEFIQNAYDEGKRIEPLAIENLRGHKWVIRDRQDILNNVGDYQIEVEIEVIPEKVKVVGHLDGMVYEGGFADYVIKECILEVKSMAGKAWQDFNKNGWEAKGPLIQKYKWQASALMLATGRPHVTVAWNKATSELAYAVATEPFYTISDIANKLQAAEDAIAAGELPGGCEDFPCPFYYLHEAKEDVAVAAADEVELLMDDWLALDRQIKLLELQRKEVRDQIVGTVVADGETVAAAKVKGECGVSVETYWQKESEYTVKKEAKWITRVSGPRGR